MTILSRFAGALIIAAATAFPAGAATLQAARGPVVLTVTGAIDTTNSDHTAQFDMEMLEALPGRITKVETPWTEGTVSFEGPLGKSLIAAVGARGKMMHITAINDYAVDVPVEDFEKYPVILATKKDGAAMPVRDKGPIFIIYPFDVDKSLFSETYFNRSVWQVKSIEFN